DLFARDTSIGQALRQQPSTRSKHFGSSEAGVEQHLLVARVDDERVELDVHVAWIKKIVGQLAPYLLFRYAQERIRRIAEHLQSVGRHRDFGIPDNKAIEVRGLTANLAHRRAPLIGACGGRPFESLPFKVKLEKSIF